MVYPKNQLSAKIRVASCFYFLDYGTMDLNLQFISYMIHNKTTNKENIRKFDYKAICRMNFIALKLHGIFTAN